MTFTEPPSQAAHADRLRVERYAVKRYGSVVNAHRFVRVARARRRARDRDVFEGNVLCIRRADDFLSRQRAVLYRNAVRRDDEYLTAAGIVHGEAAEVDRYRLIYRHRRIDRRIAEQRYGVARFRRSNGSRKRLICDGAFLARHFRGEVLRRLFVVQHAVSPVAVLREHIPVGDIFEIDREVEAAALDFDVAILRREIGKRTRADEGHRVARQGNVPFSRYSRRSWRGAFLRNYRCNR